MTAHGANQSLAQALAQTRAQVRFQALSCSCSIGFLPAPSSYCASSATAAVHHAAYHDVDKSTAWQNGLTITSHHLYYLGRE